MSQVTEQSVRFQTALASIKLIQASAVLDLTEDDFDFLTRDRKSGSAGMPRPISYAVFCLKKKTSPLPCNSGAVFGSPWRSSRLCSDHSSSATQRVSGAAWW